MTLPSYVAKLVALRILGALLVLIAILQALDLLEVTTQILDRNLGWSGVGYYVLLRVPRYIQQAAPLSVLAGGLFAFGQLARESAVAAMRAAGMSVYRLALIASPAPLIMLALHLIMGAWVAPLSDQRMEVWWRATTPVAQRTAPGPKAFRLGGDIVIATPVDDTGRELKNVHIFRRDNAGRLVQRTHSDLAVFGPGGWRLKAPEFETPGLVDVQKFSAAEMLWTNRLKPSDIRALTSNNQIISPGTLERALEGGGASRPLGFYRTQLWRAWAAPFGAIVMLLLTVPAALTNFRGGRGGTMLGACLGAGLLFMVFDGMFTAVGESGLAPAFVAAWAAPLIFAAAAITVLLHLEG